MEERDPRSACTDADARRDGLGAAAFRPIQCRFQIRDSRAHVVDPRTPRSEESRDRRVVSSGRDEFDPPRTRPEERNRYAFGLDDLLLRGLQSKKGAPSFTRFTERVDRDSDVVDYGHHWGGFVVIHVKEVRVAGDVRPDVTFGDGTYSNTQVVASTARAQGEPGLIEIAERKTEMNEAGETSAFEVTDTNFVDEIESSKGLSMVDFWAEWCGPCRLVGPVVEELAQEYADRVKVGKLDVDANPETAFRFNVRSIPSILFFKDGELVDTVVGALPKASLEEKILEHV